MFPVKIILIAYNSGRWLKPCFDSLRRVSCNNYEVILVDNGGNNMVVQLAREMDKISALATPFSMPFSEANNFALVNGGLDSEFVCFLNQDTISREDWLSACLAMMEKDEMVAAVIPLIENYDGTTWDQAFVTCAKANPELYERLQQGVRGSFNDLPEFVEVPEITAAAMVVRTEALMKAGPFDPIYGSYYEDYDLCRRIATAGYRVGICTRGRVGHYGGSVTTDRKAYLRRARWICRNRVIYAARWKWKNRLAGLVWYLALELPRNFARSLLGRSAIPFRSFLRAHLDLVPLLPRLISPSHDRKVWLQYLRAIGWPGLVEHAPTGGPQPVEIN
ncbi:glycosyltransferase [Thermogutta sp.]|uniref:glycosyltransferase family 2 protein n=1 Tax=Thermogutta sp. TaxID=1962930 RepID=UPI00321FF10C